MDKASSARDDIQAETEMNGVPLHRPGLGVPGREVPENGGPADSAQWEGAGGTR